MSRAACHGSYPKGKQKHHELFPGENVTCRKALLTHWMNLVEPLWIKTICVNKGWRVHALNPQNLSATHTHKFYCLFIGQRGICETHWVSVQPD